MKRTTSHLTALCFFLCPLISIAQTGRTLDSLQLVNLYNSTCNQGCTLNWDFSQPIDTWQGIILVNGRVNEILLWSKGLSGSIPDLQLTELTFLHLRENNLTSNLPDFTNMANLESLSLGGNQLSGTIPNFTNLPNLRGVYLWENNLSDSVPDFTGSPNLEVISLDINRLTGSIPIFNHLVNLEELSLSFNQLDGTIPNFSNINLQRIDLNSNLLTGSIPNLNLPNLQIIDFAFNDLSGSIPTFDSTDLRGIYLGANRLTGNIPAFDNLIKLEVLRLYSNNLSDTIPNFNLPELTELYLYGNQLSGNIPNLSNLTKLESLHINENRLSGEIPNFNLGTLQRLRVQGNKLSGLIPDFNGMPNLVWLEVSANELSGTIPAFSSLPNLAVLRLKNNKFSFDDIENAIINHEDLAIFTYSPQFHGTVQSNIVQIGDTITLRLSDTLHGNNNDNVLYQWKQNNNILEGSVDSTYTIDSLQLSQVGKYTLHMADPTRVADLEVISEPIYVYVKGYDLYGEPIIYNQLMIEFQSREERDDYEEEFLVPNTGMVVDSCSCNRLLYLWEFPDDTIALKVLLDVSTKTENQSREAVVSGELNNKIQLKSSELGEGWTWSGNYTDSYPDTVLIYMLDSGLDTMGLDTSKYLIPDAPIDTCHSGLSSYGYDYADTLTSITDGAADLLGHGTFGTRSIIEGLPSNININIVPLKVFDDVGQANLFNFICGLYHAIDNDADIISVSAGYSGEPSDILENAIALAQEKEQFIIAATGNKAENIDTLPEYPAYYAGRFYKMDEFGQGEWIHYDNVKSVASINAQDELSEFSSYGSNAATLAAYGENMGGYSHTGEQVSLSGTSVATFYVTRELAVEISKNKNRPYQSIWEDFEASSLRNCPSIADLTSTGKCLDINLNEVYGDFKVLLEGAYDISSQGMNATLNTERHVLPGQLGDTLFHDTAIQPYNIAPFYYSGTETVPNGFENYPTEVVDWILLSLRTDIMPETEVARTAAWVTKNGKVQLLKPLFDTIPTTHDSVYVVIEHRNHMAVMSPEKIPIQTNIISWDFTQQDSYTADVGTGQIKLSPNVWVMLTGDGSQINDINGYDINGNDKTIWQSYNGNFGQYLSADYNMDGDINGDDKIFWQRNNGKFSVIPR